MTATNHTEHYGLSQYTEDDHPTYTGDYNGDMAKIDAAKTLSTLGLTAKEYDMQYSDGYNIVRVGTPTRSTETEDSSHE